MEFTSLSNPRFFNGYRAIFSLGIFMGLLFFAGCASTPSVEENRDLARQEFEEALKLQSLKMDKEMLDHLRKATRLAPDETLYLLTLANALFSFEKLEEAELYYKDALKSDPNLTEAYRQLGRLSMHKADWKSAERYLREAVDKPGMVRPHEVYNWLALTLYAQGKFSEAEKQWKTALKIKDNFEIRVNLARAYRDNELFDLAEESLVAALDLKPQSARANYELAQLFLKKRYFEKARQHFNEVIRIEPLGEMSKASRKYLELMPPVKNHGG